MKTNEERLLAILVEMEEARREIRNVMNEYPRALKRWAEVEKMTATHYYDLSGLIVDAGTGAVTEREWMEVIARSQGDPDWEGAWRSLVDLAERYNYSIGKLSRACGKWVAFRSYEDGMERRVDATKMLGDIMIEQGRVRP